MDAIVLVTEAFGASGGIAKFNRDFLSALCGLQIIDRAVALPRSVSMGVGTLPEKLVYDTSGAKGKLSYVRRVLQVVASERRRVGLVVCGHINLLPLALTSSAITGAPLLLVVHGIDVWRPHRSWVVRTLVARVDRVLSVSNFTKQKFCSWSRFEESKITVVPNAFQQAEFGPGEKPKVLLDRYSIGGKKVILTLARLSAKERYKGVDEVLTALPELLRSIPSLVYVVAGDGSDRARLEERARDEGLQPHVRFCGFVREEEKADHYRLADAFVMPGWGEGFGIVYLEALACGIPVVASKLDGSREAVRDGMLGIIVDPHNQNELVHGIRTALETAKTVPEGLDYFGYTRFVGRIRDLVTSIVEGQADR